MDRGYRVTKALLCRVEVSSCESRRMHVGFLLRNILQINNLQGVDAVRGGLGREVNRDTNSQVEFTLTKERVYSLSCRRAI
jgi:hypothetical protein